MHLCARVCFFPSSCGITTLTPKFDLLFLLRAYTFIFAHYLTLHKTYYVWKFSMKPVWISMLHTFRDSGNNSSSFNHSWGNILSKEWIIKFKIYSELIRQRESSTSSSPAILPVLALFWLCQVESDLAFINYGWSWKVYPLGSFHITIR